jgi:RimJ/RimL family protein N-acetyltransferase
LRLLAPPCAIAFAEIQIKIAEMARVDARKRLAGLRRCAFRAALARKKRPDGRWPIAGPPRARNAQPMASLDRPLFTDRLRLEPVTVELAEAARAGGAAFAHVIGADAPADWCAASLGLVARSISHAWGPEPAPTRAVAIHLDADVVIGDVRFEPSLRAPREFEIGYGVARSRRRQGYALEMAGAVIDWLFDEAAAETVIAGCDSRNIPSVRTLRRLGFWLDSTPGQTFWWMITAELRREAREPLF